MSTGSPEFRIVAYGPTLFYLGGELDLSSAGRFHDEISESVRSGGLITMDVSALRFIDGAGIRVLRHALDEMPSGCIVIHGTNRTFRRLADVVGISDLPRLHLEGCSEDPFPRKTLRVIPSEDLAVRFQALRDSFLSLGSETRASWDAAHDLVERTRAIRATTAERRAA
jgi:anti-anti-sigma factor